MKYFSPSTSGFYALEIHGDNMPADVIEISDDRWAELLKGQDYGKWIEPDADGNPELTDPPPPTQEELVKIADQNKSTLLEQATEAIKPLQYSIDIQESTEEIETKLNEWKKYYVRLSRIDTSGAPDIVWPEKPE
ncbi:tail fiber assembly protein [Pantoea sp. NPDC088449]|uniref:tail fiber assembly protein n=1 Tax=Pantoea sp. NPDC088449 TaxID=3364392 RepID=UPI0037F3F2AB